jgi:hypothetical protein
VYDLVAEKLPAVQFKKLGQHALKNIKSGAEIFQVVMPWEGPKRHHWNWISPLRTFVRTATLNFNASMLTVMFTVSFAFFSVAGYRALRPLFLSAADELRAPASIVETPREDLSTDWSYQTAATDADQPDDTKWLPYNTQETWAYADLINGPFWLRKTFTLNTRFVEPAIVVGLIPDSHRAYLNGHFVGGSDHYGDLTFYSFDTALLTSSSPNELLIHGHTRPNLNPGLVIPPNVGAFAGEFSDVRSVVLQDHIRFHWLKEIYYVLAILLYLSCFLYAYNDRSGTAIYYYCSLILLFGCLYLTYYNPWIDAVYDFRMGRFFKAIGLTMPQIVLFSAYLHYKQKYRAEKFNNILAIAFLGTLIGVLLLIPQIPSSYLAAYNAFLTAAAAYSIVWCYPIYSFLQPREKKPASKLGRLSKIVNFGGIFTITALIGLSSLTVAVKFEFIKAILSAGAKTFMLDLSMAQPFLFAIFMVCVATMDHIRKSRLAKIKRRRDQLMLDLIHIMKTSENAHETITRIQERVCRHLRATRSTLYVFDGKKPQDMLKATYVSGMSGGKFEIKKFLAPGEGVIGYALQNGTPLLLSDIRRDPRFVGPEAKFPIRPEGKYRTGSCMIFPLPAGRQLVGVLTFADKLGDFPFNRHDFNVGLEVSPSLALLLDNRRMQEALLKARRAS